jgi:arabinosaccharide transport system substrate-binding protein
MEDVTHDPENTFVKFYVNNPFDTLLQIKDEVVAVNNNETLPGVLDEMKAVVLQKAYETDEPIADILKEAQATVEAEG